MSKSLCEKADWGSVGFRDGVEGRGSEYIGQHRKTCGAVVDEPSFERGRLEGLKEYCSPGRAYSAGASGESYSGACPLELEAVFYKNYYEGQKTYEVVMRRQAAHARLEDSREKIKKDNTVLGDVTKGVSILTGRSQTENEERLVEDLDDQVHRSLLSAPAGATVPSADQFSQNQANAFLGDSRNSLPLAGIISGATIGFGTGHAFTGLYATRGWKWTAIDAVNVAGFFAIAPSCFTTTKTRGDDGAIVFDNQTKDTGSCQLGVLALMGGVVASRVFQAIEVGKYAWNPYSVGIGPNAEGGASAYASYSW